MKNLIYSLGIISFFVSCESRLDKFTVENDDIEVTKYTISEITTMHDFVEVVKGDSAITVLETEAQDFANIVISGDTIIIESLPMNPYEFVDYAFGYRIKLDTGISYEYWLQKAKEQESQE